MTKKQERVLIRIILSAVLLIAFSLTLDGVNKYLRFALFMVPYFIIGYDVLKKAFKGILNRQVFDENFLMAVATVGAIAIAVYENGSYSEAIAVMLFYQTGELFQSYAVGKSRRNIAELMDIRPDVANVEIDGKTVETDPDDVEIGSVIVVMPGERIPIDGVVTEGSATLNTSALTGESAPRRVRVGDEVYSGCINTDGVIRIKTTKDFEESTVSKILDLVENSSMKKAKTEKFISKFARYYTPAVCISALALALLPPIIRLLAGYEALWSQWLYRALTFLVISCPCALVISIPLTFFAGIGGASRQGILVKGANYLELLSKTKYIALDKTGTVTKGTFEVCEVSAAEGVSEAELLETAEYAEYYSTHPISRSVKAYRNAAVDKVRLSDYREISGEGVTALLDGKSISAGNARLMKRLGVEFRERKNTGTVLYVTRDNRYLGYILISDVIKPTAEKAIAALKSLGIKKTVLLTGDSEQTAREVASRINVDEVYGELLPADKVEIVERLLSEKGKNEILAFAGDGINDAPVLSRCDIGIAMGALGSDAAIEAADVVLMDDDPEKIPKAICVSKKCLRIVYENIIFAIGVKLLCLLLGALGIANMWLAIFADVGVMIIAVINAVRALKQ